MGAKRLTLSTRWESETKGDVALDHCQVVYLNHGAQRCISLCSLRVDATVAAEVVEGVQPLGIEALQSALETRGREDVTKRRRVELALEQARF